MKYKKERERVGKERERERERNSVRIFFVSFVYQGKFRILHRSQGSSKHKKTGGMNKLQ